MTLAPNPRRDFVPDLLDSSEIEEPGPGAVFGARTPLFRMSIPAILSHAASPWRETERAINSL
jgi:hypothetical protein